MVDQLLGPYLVKAGEAKNIFGRPGKGIGEGPLPGNELKMPCENCWIVATQAMLEYKDGKEANIDTGAWLHHMVSLP